MDVSDGMWASIESQIPMKKERPKLWLLFLLLAFSAPFLMYTLDGPSATEGIAQNSTFTGSSPTLTFADYQQNDNFTATKGQQNSLSSNTSSSGSTNKNFTKSKNNLAQGQSHRLTHSGLRNNLTTDYLTELSSSNTQGISSTTSKKLKFLNNPFAQSVKKGDKGNFKLIEKSRIFNKSGSINRVTTLAANFYTSGVCVNHDKRLAEYGQRFDIGGASAAACPSFEKYYSGFYAFAEVTNSIAFQKLSSENPSLSAHVAERIMNEKSAYSYSASIGVGKKWNNGIIVETGLNYDRININSETYGQEGSRRMLILIDSVMTSTGWVTTIDTTFIQTEDKVDKFNKFTQFNFPVSIGYEYEINDRFSLIGKSGVLFNISSSNSGTLKNESGESFVYNSEVPEANYFKTNLGLSFNTNLLLKGNITPLLSAYGGLRVNFYPSSFSLSTNPIDQTYTKTGLTAGVMYRL